MTNGWEWVKAVGGIVGLFALVGAAAGVIGYVTAEHLSDELKQNPDLYWGSVYSVIRLGAWPATAWAVAVLRGVRSGAPRAVGGALTGWMAVNQWGAGNPAVHLWMAAVAAVLGAVAAYNWNPSAPTAPSKRPGAIPAKPALPTKPDVPAPASSRSRPTTPALTSCGAGARRGESAAADYGRSLFLFPNAALHRARGLALVRLGREAESRMDFDASLQHHPKDRGGLEHAIAQARPAPLVAKSEDGPRPIFWNVERGPRSGSRSARLVLISGRGLGGAVVALLVGHGGVRAVLVRRLRLRLRAVGRLARARRVLLRVRHGGSPSVRAPRPEAPIRVVSVSPRSPTSETGQTYSAGSRDRR